jgi:hypothetical protein
MDRKGIGMEEAEKRADRKDKERKKRREKN